MNLAVFDIDGTLTHTNAVDEMCFIEAFRQRFGVETASSDWTECPHVTDTALVDAILGKHFGRAPTPLECELYRETFVGILQKAVGREPISFQEVPGARATVTRLIADGWAIALATGGYRASAESKLKAAGLDLMHFPAGFAEDGPSRERIVTTAVEQAVRHHGQSFERIVSIGDGVWDVRTARRLGLPFVGIARADHAVLLRTEGADTVLPDLSDTEAVLLALTIASCPPPT